MKRGKKIHFNIVDSFNSRKELIQVGLYSVALLSAVYKTFVLNYVKVSSFVIVEMLKPMTVWILSIMILKEKFNRSYTKYVIFALLGLALAKCDQNFSVQHLWFLISFLLFASLGAVTTRGYARKKKEAVQAIGTECLVFGLYGLILLPIRGTLDFSFFINPYILVISFLAFARHIMLIVGVKKASSAVSIELFALSKPVFQLILGALLLNDIPSFYKILGICIISLSLGGFWKIEKNFKKNSDD
ncbi:MAG: hypothetical protein LBD41_00050 [Clostridiales Family XIII bacterium]|nr:hypothetical protein [Clostridiales Family XIII bacterium]